MRSCEIFFGWKRITAISKVASISRLSVEETGYCFEEGCHDVLRSTKRCPTKRQKAKCSCFDRSCCPLAVIDPNISAPRTKIDPINAPNPPQNRRTTHRAPKSSPKTARRTPKTTPKRHTVHRNRPQNRRTTHRAPKSSPKTAHRAPKSTSKTAHRTPKPSPKRRTSHQNPPERAACARTKAPYSTGLGIDSHQVLSNLASPKRRTVHRNRPENRRTTHRAPKSSLKPAHRAPKASPKTTHRAPKSAPKSAHHTPSTKIHPAPPTKI